MVKYSFKYRRMKYILLWMFFLGAPFIWFLPEALEFLANPYYWIINTIAMVLVIFVLWSLMDKLPGITKEGWYWMDDGCIVIEYNARKVYLNNVTELMLTDKHQLSKGINLLIRNDSEKIEFLSEKIGKSTRIEDTDFYQLFSVIRAEFPLLIHETDVFDEPIENWYKTSEDRTKA